MEIDFAPIRQDWARVPEAVPGQRQRHDGEGERCEQVAGLAQRARQPLHQHVDADVRLLRDRECEAEPDRGREAVARDLEALHDRAPQDRAQDHVERDQYAAAEEDERARGPGGDARDPLGPGLGR
ncbi:MAG: hypothetical protein M5U07_20800 [Xanthobacteraceae bacterium]|nr:hypothetical protein [Xanthobacteraceae bacterium]